MQDLHERVEGFVQAKIKPVQRNGQSYSETETFVARAIRLCLWSYNRLDSLGQTARLLRDTIDFLLRRYHGYSIKENIGGHYREVGMAHDEKTDFEHVIPAAVLRELLIYGRITLNEALHPPTCIMRKRNHKKLNAKAVTASQTPDLKYFWKRYQQVLPNIQIETHDGTPVDMNTWTWQDHCKYFNI